MTRLARGSMPWPVRRDGRPAALGSVTVEAPPFSAETEDFNRWLSLGLAQP